MFIRHLRSAGIRLGLAGTIATLAFIAGFASIASAYETGYGPIQLVSVSQTIDPPGCTASDADATIIKGYAPQYPEINLEQGLEGYSLVTFTMALDGSVSNVALAGTSGNRLFDRAAVDAVKKSHFAPATRHCDKVAGVYGVPVVFAKGQESLGWATTLQFGGSGRPVIRQ